MSAITNDEQNIGGFPNDAAKLQRDREILAAMTTSISRPGLDRLLADNPYMDVNSSACDAVFSSALRRARNLLAKIDTPEDEDVHAYQFFSESDKLMSNNQISEQLKKAGWDKPCSPNTIGACVTALLEEAETRIEKCISDHYRRLNGMEDKNSHAAVRQVVEKMLLSLSSAGDPSVKVDDTSKFAKRLESTLVAHLEQKGHSRIYDDVEFLGASTYFEYVCGMTSEQFHGRSPTRPGKVTLKQLDQIIGCLQWLANSLAAVSALSDAHAEAARQLSILIAFDQSPVLQAIRMRMSSMNNQPVEDVKHDVRDALSALASYRSHLAFVDLWSSSKVIESVSNIRSTPLGGKGIGDFSNLLSLLYSADTLAATTSLPSGEDAIETLLKELRREANKRLGLLKDTSQNLFASALHVMAVLKIDEPGCPLDAEETLSRLMTPKSRKVRPYELFLFAAQNHLERDCLVTRESCLKGSIRPAAPRSSRESILFSHGGIDLYFGKPWAG